MKQVVLIFGVLAIAANLSLGYILTIYLWRAAVASSIALGIGLMLLILVSCTKMKDAFRISLNVLIPFFTLIEFGALLFVPAEGFDNVGYIVAIVLVLVQLLLLLAANSVSKIN